MCDRQRAPNVPSRVRLSPLLHAQAFAELTELVERLLGCGVDVVTSGNHGWDGPDTDAVHRHPRVLRPHNFPEGAAGKGIATLELGGERVSVINLGSPTAAMPGALPPYGSWADAGLEGTVVVDFHGDSAWEKMEFATAVEKPEGFVKATVTM